MSLGKSIQALSPNTTDAKMEAKKGMKEADSDIKESQEAQSASSSS
jgi:hypothetical protein